MASQMMEAWRLLDRESLRALLEVPKQGLPAAVVLTPDRAADALAAIPMLIAVQQMITRAVEQDGLTLTATGALSRADTRALFDLLEWPDYSKQEVLAVNRVLNEADVAPIAIMRGLLQVMGLLRRRDKKLMATKKAKALMEPAASSELFAFLFETLMWRVSLAYFDTIPNDPWPQDHIGVVLWCLSVAANDWTDPSTLAQVCTIPDERVAGASYDLGRYVITSRVLKPLIWLDLMEMSYGTREDASKLRRPTAYRKSSLFDAVLGFRVETLVREGGVH